MQHTTRSLVSQLARPVLAAAVLSLPAAAQQTPRVNVWKPPGAVVDKSVPRFEGTGGDKLQPSALVVDDAGVLSGVTLPAAAVSVVDAGAFYTAADVEALLQELGTEVYVNIPADIAAAASGGSGDMTKAVYDPNDDGVIAAAQLDPALATEAEVAAGYQPLDADLTAIAALATTAFGRGLLAEADAAAARGTLGVNIGTDVQAHDADLDDLADGLLTGTKVGVMVGDAGAGGAGGAVPAPAAGDAAAGKYLSAAGTWSVPAGGGSGDMTKAVYDPNDDGVIAAAQLDPALATEAEVAAGYQPLDADLTSLAAAAATGALYYRSAAETWAPLTIGTGLSLSAGTLSATGGNGDVTAASNFGTDNRLIRSDGTAKGVQGSAVTLDDSGNVTGVKSLHVNAAIATPAKPLSQLSLWVSNYNETSALGTFAWGLGDKPEFAGGSARGTMSSPSATVLGDTLLQIAGYGYGVSSWDTTPSARIRMRAANNFSTGYSGGHITLETQRTTVSSAPLERMRVTADGNVLIGTTDEAGLTGAGNLRVDGTVEAGAVTLPTGSALTAAAGSTVNLADATVSLPATVALESEVLTLTNTTAFTPTGDYHPATKKYVDDAVAGAGGSGDMTKAVYDPNDDGVIAAAQLDPTLATEAEVAAGYQPLDADLTDLADGELSGAKVGPGIDAANITAGTLDAARLPANPARGTQSVAATDIDWSAGQFFAKTISANTTFTFSGTGSGQALSIAVTSTGSFTVTWPAGVKWKGGTAPTQTASGTDVYTFVNLGGTIYGAVAADMQ